MEFTDLEQVEAGDTLTHTWLISTWIETSWHWFYFYSSFAGIFSLCTSPIYEYFYDYFYALWGIEEFTQIIVPPPVYSLVMTEEFSGW